MIRQDISLCVSIELVNEWKQLSLRLGPDSGDFLVLGSSLRGGAIADD